jgi:lipid A 3-O-deacylase
MNFRLRTLAVDTERELQMIFVGQLRVQTFIALLFVLTAILPLQAKAQSKPAADDPVAQERASKGWEYGPFFNGGMGVGNRSDYKFIWTGFQIGKPITPVLKAGILSGQFELNGEVIPFFQAYTPAPYTHTGVLNGVQGTYTMGGGTFTGFSIAPVIFRWNFATHSKRIQPWFQAKGAVLYTTHKFPPDYFATYVGEPSGTSVWNFMPQGGVGFHYFTGEKRSIDVGLNAVHISSASLGDKNPGVNASLQLQVGYSFWK